MNVRNKIIKNEFEEKDDIRQSGKPYNKSILIKEGVSNINGYKLSIANNNNKNNNLNNDNLELETNKEIDKNQFQKQLSFDKKKKDKNDKSHFSASNIFGNPFNSMFLSEDKHVSKSSVAESEEVDENETIRTKLDLFYNEGSKRKFVELTTAFLSFITFIIFIVSTYYEDGFVWFEILDAICCAVFSFEILINFVIAQHRWNFIIDKETIVDCFTSIVPLFGVKSSYKILFKVARSFRILKVSKFMYKKIRNYSNEVAKQVSIMILYILTQIFIFTLLFSIIENDYVKFYVKYLMYKEEVIFMIFFILLLLLFLLLVLEKFIQ